MNWEVVLSKPKVFPVASMFVQLILSTHNRYLVLLVAGVSST